MPSVSSPCVGLCTVDGPSGFCIGCGRTLDEIAGWSDLPEPRRLAVMAGLRSRLEEAGQGPERSALDCGTGDP